MDGPSGKNCQGENEIIFPTRLIALRDKGNVLGHFWGTMLRMQMRKPVSPEDREFFREFGSRLAKLRKQRGLSQAQVADAIGCSQPQVFAFEKGQRRMPLSALPALAKILEVSIEDLFKAKPKPQKRGPRSALEVQLERVAKLPRTKKKFISQMIEVALQQAELEESA